MTRAFRLYEWIGPVLFTPLAVWFWLQLGSAPVALIAVTVPILHGYVVPAVGTNVLKVWGFTTRVRIGNFRLQHGFLFGSATASITALLFMLLGPDASSLARIVTTGATLLAINWVYDALAIEHGVLVVRNQPWADGRSAWAVSGDYVLWFFGLFGLIYGALLDLAIRRLPADATISGSWHWVALGALATMLAPTLCYIAASRLRHGHSGCRPVNSAGESRG